MTCRDQGEVCRQTETKKGTKTRTGGAPGQEQARSEGGEKAGQRGRTCKSSLRSFGFLLQVMARPLKILETSVFGGFGFG